MKRGGTELAIMNQTEPPVHAAWDDYVHIGPGTLGGRYMRTFWHPVYRAQDLQPGRAAPIQVLGERVTLYRGESGRPYLIAFRCAHRGSQLSVGWIEGDDLHCRYHGWAYGGNGQCVLQPGEDEDYASKIRVPAYPAEEHLGLIFVYLGEGEPPELRRFPDFDRPGVLEAPTSIERFMVRDDLSSNAKRKILCDNVKTLYGMK
ncbi:MAG: Rieske (2Fe-2S) domain protein [Chloroflexi bacterium]|nr:Rieske (2Fe-2S) domain protein [Chloroflexota bacterium]